MNQDYGYALQLYLPGECSLSVGPLLMYHSSSHPFGLAAGSSSASSWWTSMVHIFYNSCSNNTRSCLIIWQELEEFKFLTLTLGKGQCSPRPCWVIPVTNFLVNSITKDDRIENAGKLCTFDPGSHCVYYVLWYIALTCWCYLLKESWLVLPQL